MKAKFLKLHNFIQREFYSDSRQYFNKRFYFAFESILFNKNQINHWDNKNELKFSSLLIQYPFIEDLISYRKKTNTLEEYCDISYEIITDYYNRLKKENTLYTNDFFQSKQEVFANNVVKDKRTDFFISLKIIFSMIEEHYSIEFKNRNPDVLPIINKQKELLTLLYKNEILDENLKWNPDNKNHKKKYISALVYKLRLLKLAEYSNYKEFQKKFEELIQCKFDYDTSTGIIKDFEKETIDSDSLLYLESLSFLDTLNNK